MTILDPLKQTAQKVIAFTSNEAHGPKTWDEQPSAPEGGFTDRAGFLIEKYIESCADIVLVDKDSALIRARIAKTTGTGDDERFYIISLDFSADTESVKKGIENSSALSSQTLTDILGQTTTVPQRIQVSYGTGRDRNGNLVGKRYEYYKDQILALPGEEVGVFTDTLSRTYDSIMSDYHSS